MAAVARSSSWWRGSGVFHRLCSSAVSVTDGRSTVNSIWQSPGPFIKEGTADRQA